MGGRSLPNHRHVGAAGTNLNYRQHDGMADARPLILGGSRTLSITNLKASTAAFGHFFSLRRVRYLARSLIADR
jgi:hypothetical protein